MINSRNSLAIYVHWPFCISKCPYCDFNSHVGDTDDQEKWRRAYQRELEYYAALLSDRQVTSIFFGGGTPSLMAVNTVESVIQNIARLWSIAGNAEITLEANPSSAEVNKFNDFRKAGVNRLSLGVQSLNDDALQFLGRAHDASEAKSAIALAVNTFPRFSFDLIYARQGQTPSMWQQELRQALLLAHDHLSLYQLTIEPHTQFYTRTRRGDFLTATDDHAAEMFEATQEEMSAAGLPAYEISNHARIGQESRHNMAYWHYDEYLGIGPGAHGRLAIQDLELDIMQKQKYPCRAIENHRAPETWLQHVDRFGHGIKANNYLDIDTAMHEAFMMGLRLTTGIDLATWHNKFAVTLPEFLPADRLKRLIDEDFIIHNQTTLRATQTGLQRLNAILAYLN